MNRLVFSVFKTIAFAMIFVFVWDMAFYLYRVSSLNQRMENIMTSMQKVVMENNCMPEEDAKMYYQLLVNMASDFNGGSFANNGTGEFVARIGWNFSENARDSRGNLLDSSNSPLQVTGDRATYNASTGRWSTRSVNLLHHKMGEVGAYGDIQTVQVRVMVYQPFWGFGTGGGTDYVSGGTAAGTAQGGEFGGANWQRRDKAASVVLSYTYYVPCLKYKSVTQ